MDLWRDSAFSAKEVVWVLDTRDLVQLRVSTSALCKRVRVILLVTVSVRGVVPDSAAACIVLEQMFVAAVENHFLFLVMPNFIH